MEIYSPVIAINRLPGIYSLTPTQVNLRVSEIDRPKLSRWGREVIAEFRERFMPRGA